MAFEVLLYGIQMLFGSFFLLIFLGFIIFTLLMFYHAWTHRPDTTSVLDEYFWVGVIFFTGLLGAIVYYFTRYRTGERPPGTPAASPTGFSSGGSSQAGSGHPARGTGPSTGFRELSRAEIAQRELQQAGQARSYSQTPADRTPRFLRMETRPGGFTYEIYRGIDSEAAVAFLKTKDVDRKLYYLIVETPDGNWGRDIDGLFKEHLEPWQFSLDKKDCNGTIIETLGGKTRYNLGALRNENHFAERVSCGRCGKEWIDGLQYQNLTLVRCPGCRAFNLIDTREYSGGTVYLIDSSKGSHQE